jgi:hypothetical protein
MVETPLALQALTIARMPALIASGSSGHAACLDLWRIAESPNVASMLPAILCVKPAALVSGRWRGFFIDARRPLW